MSTVPEHASSGRNDHLVHLGGACAILGPIVTTVFLLLRPETDAYVPLERTLRIYLDQASLFELHTLGVSVGFLLLLGGFVGLDESLRDDKRAAAWSRLALVTAVLATLLALFLVALDGTATVIMAERWAAASAAEKDVVLRVIEGAWILNGVLVPRVHLAYFLTYLLFAVAVWYSDVYHRYLRWSGVPLGAIGLLVGTLALLQGIPTEPAGMRDGVVLIALFGWFLVVGVSMWRASDPAAETGSSP